MVSIKSSNKMAPPSYADLDLLTRKVLKKGYNFGLCKLNIGTKTANGMVFSTAGQSNLKNGEVSGSIKAKYSLPDYGLTVTEKWNTDNTLISELAFKDKLLEGLELGLACKFSPVSISKSADLKIGYGHEYFKLDTKIRTSDFVKPLLNASGVFIYDNTWFAGLKTAFDTKEMEFTANELSIGGNFSDPECRGYLSVNMDKEVKATFYRKINPLCAVGLLSELNIESMKLSNWIGMSYALTDDITMRAKCSDAFQCAVSYQIEFRKGLMFSLSALLEKNDSTFGINKFGCSLDLEG